ncbi:AraC family transcriptional regulator [Paenibacillus harenae]|uniref:AraC family transcriptional regulator n=1 Tax=Paenibacillus harenae TaxID=306543 RepID=UPI002794BF73|nr:AraC family transcriptional regulator [Paenibacillus harenae]MDQ0058583.1 AraC-like DNA-binding protein [Paenibacillus harenae]
MLFQNEQQTLSDLLQSVQLQIHAADYTQVSDEWGEEGSLPPYNKLYYICGGEGWIRIGDTEYAPKAGQLFVAPAHSPISFGTVGGRRPFLKYWCHFSITAGPFDLFQWIGMPLCINARDSDRITALFQAMVECKSQQTIASRLREKAVLLELVALYLEDVPVRVLQHRSEEISRLHIIQQYVASHLGASITVEHMAEAVHLHPNYFIAYFKKHLGVPPMKYVNLKRAERAKLLLTTTSLSIKEIADQTGFQDTSHFTKFFRKETSLSPTEYRAAHHRMH